MDFVGREITKNRAPATAYCAARSVASAFCSNQLAGHTGAEGTRDVCDYLLQHAIRREEVKFPPAGAPFRLPRSISRHPGLARPVRKRAHIDLRPACLVRTVPDVSAVWRKSSLRLVEI